MANNINITPDQGQLDMLSGNDGVDIPVRAYGITGDKIPVLMMHGLESHSAWFWQSGMFLGGLGHPTYIIDRRGSGRSKEPRGDCKDYADMLADIQSVIKKVTVNRDTKECILFGHCFGAIPTTIFSMLNSDQVKALVLSTPAIFTLADLHLAEKLKVFGSKLTGNTTLIPTPIADHNLFTKEPKYLDFIANDKLKLELVTARFYWEVLRARIYIQKHIKKLTIPLLMATAGMDEICDNYKNMDFFNHIASANKSLLNYPNAVHIFEYSPEKEHFFADLKGWLEIIDRN